RLTRSEDAAAQALAGLLWAEADDFARAVRALERSAGHLPPEVEVERLAWMARLAHAAGDRASAADFADEAASVYTARGEAAAAAQQRDYVALLRAVQADDLATARTPSPARR